MKKLTTNELVKIGILAAIGFILMFFEMAVPFAPPFMKVGLDDIPALIGSFAMGPIAGVIVQLIVNIFALIIRGSTTGGVGEISNFIVGSVFVFVAGYIYKKDKTLNRAVLGMVAGVLSMTIVATLSNYFVIFPLYAKVMISMDEILTMGAAVNKRVTDLKAFMVYIVVPFNLFKGTVVSVITRLIYKNISHILKR